MNSGRKKYIMGGVALALAGALTIGGIVGRMNNVRVEAAKNTLDGIERIVNENSSSKPFTILEIVPQGTVNIPEVKTFSGNIAIPAGTIGYLISGNEPVNIERTLRQIPSSDDRKTFMNKLREALAPVADEIEGNKPLTMVSYNEFLGETLTDEEKASGTYSKFVPSGSVSLNGLDMVPVSANGKFVKKYREINDDGSINTDAWEFFDENRETVFKSTSGNDGDFDPRFGLATGVPGTESGIYNVVFVANSGSRASYMLTKSTDAEIKPGLSNNTASGNKLGLPLNTCLYTKNDDETYTFAGYLAEVDGKVSVNATPTFEPYVFTTGEVTSLHLQEFRAGRNPNRLLMETKAPETGEIPDLKDEPASGNDAPVTPAGGNTETPSEDQVPGGTVSSGQPDPLPGTTVSGGSPETGNEGPVSQNPVEEAAGEGEVTYYILDFKCVEDGSGTYNIQSFQRIKEDSGKFDSYKLTDVNDLIPNYEHKGSVKNLNDTDKCIVFEKTDNGNYNAVKNPGNTTKVYFEGIEIYYTGEYKNNEWFKQFVFDRDTPAEYAGLKIEVYTVSAASVTFSDIENAGLIYLSSATNEFLPDYESISISDYTAGKNDLVPEVSKTLAYQACMRNKPVIVDYQLLKDESLKSTYAWKTAKVFSAKNVKEAYNKYSNGFKTDNIETKPDEDKTWVSRNIYIFNDFLHPLDWHTVLNEDFKTENGDNKSYINDGLTEVIEDIKRTNEPRPSTKWVPETVHEATIIRYILNVSKQDILGTKERLRILEIEPMELDFSEYSKQPTDGRIWAKKKDGKEVGMDGYATLNNNGTYTYSNGRQSLKLNLKYDLSVTVSEDSSNVLQYTKWDEDKPQTYSILSTTGKIEITKMPTAEFIGRVEDLNSEYDMIFIGDDTSAMNHETVVRKDNNGTPIGWYVGANTWGSTEYNDSDMNGLIYSNVGDYNYISRKFLGALPADYKNKSVDNKFSNLVDMGDYKGEDKNGSSYDPNTTVGRTRFAGNDIKKADIDKIMDFAKADYPVVFGDMLVNDEKGNRTVNDVCVDNCSHMYQLIKKLLSDDGTKDNVFRISDITNRNVQGAGEAAEEKARRKLFLNSIEGLKPEIKLTSPTLDANDKAPVTLSDTGNYLIDLKFRIDDIGSGKSSQYSAHFYTDLNADGKYAVNEELKGGSIRFTDSAGNGVAQGTLNAGSEYRAICELDKTYVAGVYPWKLAVTQVDNEHRRDSIIGYATVTLSEKKTLNVLQITSNAYQKINLKTYMDEDKKANGRKTALGYYLNNIPGFELKMTQVGSKDFITNKVKPQPGMALSPEDYLKELRKYDLVIVGFADTYRWGDSSEANMEKENMAAEGLLGYIAEGNSVLFTHDATSYYNVDSRGEYDESLDNNGDPKTYYWGFSFNQYLRNIVGMNRYGIPTKADSSTNPTIRALLSGQKFDDIFQPRSNPSGSEGGGVKLNNSQAHGIVNFSLIRGQIDRARWGDWDRYWMEPEDMDIDNKPANTSLSSWVTHFNNHYPSRISNAHYTQGDNSKTVGVERVNRGQITEYPYVLPEKFDVTNTHGQYYQLNLDLDDDKDGESDVVVWYTLGAVNPVSDTGLYHMYTMTGKDVRNNYYIYNRGNLTYSGQGHTNFTDANDTYTTSPEQAVDATECKLLVNTIIAAYSAGTRESQATFHETGNIASKKITSDIIPYDTLYNITEDKEEDFFPGAGRKVSGNTASDPTMTAYVEISDTNIVFSKKIYARFGMKSDASKPTDATNPLLPLEVISVTPLTDDGQEAVGYRDVNASYNAATGEFLMYDSTNLLDFNSVNAGKMFKVVYSLKNYNLNTNAPVLTATNVPGIAVTTRTEIQRKEGGIVTESTAEDDLILLRTQLFNLK